MINIFVKVFVCTFFIAVFLKFDLSVAAENTSNEDKITSTPVNQKLTNDAVSYLNSITEKLAVQRKAYFVYIQSVTKLRRARTVEKKRQELISEIKVNKDYFKDYNSFNGDSSMKSELHKYLDMQFIVLKEDFDKILDMEVIEAQSYDQVEAHQTAMDLAFEKLDTCFSTFERAEDQFFKKYNIKKNEDKDEMTIKMETANKVIDYYNSVYRIFFKSNKENSYARDAINKKDVAGLEQHTMTLLSFAQDGIEKLKKIAPYDGDGELVAAALKLLEFYIKEGKETFPINVEFNLSVDKFTAAQKKFSSIKEADRTEDDIDQYNQAVNVYNKTVKELNKTNNVSFKTHRKLLDQWNNQVEAFFKNHS